MDNFGDSF